MKFPLPHQGGEALVGSCIHLMMEVDGEAVTEGEKISFIRFSRGCKKTASKKSEIREERVSDDFLY